jgi:hypothetical protein
MRTLDEFVEHAVDLLGATKRRLVEGHDVGPFAVMLKEREMVGALELDDRSPDRLLATLDIVRALSMSHQCDAVLVVFHAESIMVTEQQAEVERRRQLLIQRTKEQEKQLKRPLPATAVLCYTCKKQPSPLVQCRT